MRLLLSRFETEKDATLGRLEIAGPVFRIFTTIERNPAILPAGLYPIRFEYSPRFKRYLWELKDVPGHTEIKIHNGNTANHSDGCILIGMRHGQLNGQPATLESRRALELFTRAMSRYEASMDVKIEVENARG